MRRGNLLIGTTLAVLIQLGPPLIRSILGWPTLVLWNASASAPIGLYLLRPAMPLQIQDLVAVRPPIPLAHYMAARGYLPMGVPLLKHVGALGGQIVCRAGRKISIDGNAAASARDSDSHGRPLPVWHGCRALGPSEVFLLNASVPDSFDGRYFGALPVRAIVGRAVPLWLRKEPH